MRDAKQLGMLVHEVRSPVAALAAVAEAAAEPQALDAASDARGALVRLALAACSAIERIVLDVAAASVEPAEVDVGAVASDAVTSFRLRGADVVFELRPGELRARADPVRLRQALDNLVTNALVHGQGTDPVRVSVRRSGDVLAVVVADSGAGIPQSELGRIFEPGVRLAASTPGSGIGLALTRAIVEAHGGTIAVESPAGERGTAFTMVLPALELQPATGASTT